MDKGTCTNLTTVWHRGKVQGVYKVLSKKTVRPKITHFVCLMIDDKCTSVKAYAVCVLTSTKLRVTLQLEWVLITEWWQSGAPVHTWGSLWQCAGPPSRCWIGSTSVGRPPRSSRSGLCPSAGQRRIGTAASRPAYLGWLCPGWPGHVRPTGWGEACWLPPGHSDAKDKIRGKNVLLLRMRRRNIISEFSGIIRESGIRLDANLSSVW